jgi:hypothetical protein
VKESYYVILASYYDSKFAGNKYLMSQDEYQQLLDVSTCKEFKTNTRMMDNPEQKGK